jgi:hypothetical protein
VAVDIYRRTRHDTLTLEELRLYHAITDYRAGQGLDPLPLSKDLTATAGRHVLDTRENIWRPGLDLPDGATLHSWSDAFYFADHRRPEVMWEAPARLGTGYDGTGYEISAAGQPGVEAALDGWQSSPGHDAILAGRGAWRGVEMRAIGIGVETSPGPGPYAGGTVYHVWFGDVADTDPPTIAGSRADERVPGTAFEDRVFARGGDDVLLGGRGPDRLAAGPGDDRIAGGPGRDRLIGGEGADTFVFAAAGRAAEDRLRDFEPGTDRIDLRAFAIGRRDLEIAPGSVAADLDGDGRPDLRLHLPDAVEAAKEDILL